MRTLLCLMVGLGLWSGVSAANNQPAEFSAGITHTFIPEGYDTNDPVFISISGQFTNVCDRVGKYEFTHKGNEIRIKQTGLRYRGSNRVCLDLPYVYTNHVELKIFDKVGDYQVIDDASGKQIGTLSITEARRSEPDDELYAPVNTARITLNKKGDAFLTVEGFFPNDCMDLNEQQIKVDVQADHTVVVRPIASDLAERLGKTIDQCGIEKKYFSRTIPLKDNLRNIWLLHVRTTGGQRGRAIHEFQFLDL